MSANGIRKPVPASPMTMIAIWKYGLLCTGVCTILFACNPSSQQKSSPVKQNATGPNYTSEHTKAVQLLAKGDLEGAISTCNMIIAAKPSNSFLKQALITRGFARIMSGKPQSAVEDFSAAIQISPSDDLGLVQALAGLGDAHAIVGRYDLAADDYKRTLDASQRLSQKAFGQYPKEKFIQSIEQKRKDSLTKRELKGQGESETESGDVKQKGNSETRE